MTDKRKKSGVRPSTEGVLYFDENGKRVSETLVCNVPDRWAALLAASARKEATR